MYKSVRSFPYLYNCHPLMIRSSPLPKQSDCALQTCYRTIHTACGFIITVHGDKHFQLRIGSHSNQTQQTIDKCDTDGSKIIRVLCHNRAFSYRAKGSLRSITDYMVLIKSIINRTYSSNRVKGNVS
ncbi:hypothetical protein D3C86_989260 [compost metagenome]